MPNIIASMAGADPVWVVDGAYGRWRGANNPIKTVWVLSRAGEGELEVRGRRLDGEGALSFRIGRDGAVREALLIRDPFSRSMIPGGASCR